MALWVDTAQSAIHVLTAGKTTTSWVVWNKLADARFVAQDTLTLTNDYGAYFFDDYGQLPCLKDKQPYYYNSTIGKTGKQGLPVVAGSKWEVTQLNPANKAGAALVEVARLDTPVPTDPRILLYDCKRRKFVGDSAQPFHQAVFLTDRLLKVRRGLEWRFQPVDTAGFGQRGQGVFQTIVARDTTGLPAPAAKAPSPTKPPLATGPAWEYAAIDGTGQLHLFDRSLREYRPQAPLPAHADKFWWLPDSRDFIVRDASAGVVGWQWWKNGAPVGNEVDKAREMRPLAKNWFLCQSGTSHTRYYIRQFNQKATADDTPLRLPDSLDNLVIAHGPCVAAAAREVVHLVWRGSAVRDSAVTYLLSNNAKPALKRPTGGERIIPYGRVLAILNAPKSRTDKHPWRLYDYGRSTDLPKYYLLNWQPMTLPGDPVGRYFVAQPEAQSPGQRLIRYAPGQPLREYSSHL